MSDTLADRLAAFALSTRFEDLPRGRRGRGPPSAARLARHAPPVRWTSRRRRSRGEWRGGPQGTPSVAMIGGGSAAPDWAAFANGVHIRYLDCNDTYLSLEPAHPSDNWAAVMAAGQIAGADGRDWIAAAAVAYEAQCRLCDAASIRARGWDHTTYGSISAALAASKLLGLSHEQTVHALGIAGTTGTALRLTRAGELSMWKGCAFAFAARNGVFAAMLAADGLTGPAPLFEGEMGFFQQVSGPFELHKLGGPRAERLDAAEDLDQVRSRRVSQPVGDRRGLRAPARRSATRPGSARSRSPPSAWPSRSSPRTPRSGGPRPARRPTTACPIARPSRWSTAGSRPTSSPRRSPGRPRPARPRRAHPRRRGPAAHRRLPRRNPQPRRPSRSTTDGTLVSEIAFPPGHDKNPLDRRPARREVPRAGRPGPGPRPRRRRSSGAVSRLEGDHAPHETLALLSA